MKPLSKVLPIIIPAVTAEERAAEKQEEIERIMTDEELRKAVVQLHSRKSFGLDNGRDYVKRNTGEFFRFNLDPYSFKQLQEAYEKFKTLGLNMSYSVLLRDALRRYNKFAQSINAEDTDAIEERTVELIKCMRGWK